MSSPGRPKLPPRRQVLLRIDEALLLELYTYTPKLQSTEGGTRYGELNKYFTSLLVQDLAKKRAGVKKEEPKT